MVLAIVFVLPPGGSASPKFKVLHRFGGTDGAGLWGSLAFDKKGDLYGTAAGGGTHNAGTVFELMPHSDGRWTEAILHNFCSLPHCADGSLPFSNVVLDDRGDLYGTTTFEAFEMTAGSNGWSFNVLDNQGSRAGLTLDDAGKVYGNIGPGEYDNGAVTELVPGAGGWTQSYLYSFCAKSGCPDGAIPVSGVVFDGSGNLYGTTEYGGTGQLGGLGGGTAYQLKHNSDGTWQHVTLHNFPAFRGDGVYLYAGLVLDRSGNLYGATAQGGSGDCGTVFKLTHGAKGWKETLVHDFTHPKDGCGPNGVTFDQAGNLYGTTVSGGAGDCSGGCGVVFKLTPNSGGKWNYSLLHRFNDYDGALPDAGVIFDQKGNLYGTTELGGGGHSVGVVFEITP